MQVQVEEAEPEEIGFSDAVKSKKGRRELQYADAQQRVAARDDRSQEHR